jgi:hypothetical protein
LEWGSSADFPANEAKPTILCSSLGFTIDAKAAYESTEPSLAKVIGHIQACLDFLEK